MMTCTCRNGHVFGSRLIEDDPSTNACIVEAQACPECGDEEFEITGEDYADEQCGGPISFSDRESTGKLGTPLSELSGQPGHPGYERFCAIARSWGYD
jgi:hypothetical protein